MVVAKQLVGWLVMAATMVTVMMLTHKTRSWWTKVNQITCPFSCACFFLVLLVSHIVSIFFSHLSLSLFLSLLHRACFLTSRRMYIDSSQDLCRLTLILFLTQSLFLSISKTSSSFSLKCDMIIFFIIEHSCTVFLSSFFLFFKSSSSRPKSGYKAKRT